MPHAYWSVRRDAFGCLYTRFYWQGVALVQPYPRWVYEGDFVIVDERKSKRVG
jgi:hypothetical protein